MRLKKIRIVIEREEKTMKRWAKALRGEVRSVDNDGTVIFENVEMFAKIVTPMRLQLMSVILKEKPKSIYALAKLAKRDFKNVHLDVNVLAGLGFIELVKTRKRSALKPVAKFSGLELDLAA